MRLAAYFAGLDRARTLLWAAFLWYLTQMGRHPSLPLRGWINAAGIAAAVGAVLLANTWSDAGVRPRLGAWQGARFFMIPFCVSSYSTALRDVELVLIFPANLADNAAGLGVIALVFAGAHAFRRLADLGARGK
ncbi:MAG: hypothetical protein HYV95_08940 [Opitutae bacterium]|nr:hypothetical protein [Opitutae bacterium]